MKNLVLMFCAFALFSFSSCEKCLNCVKITTECGFCDYSSGGNSSTFCNDESTTYDAAKGACNAGAGIWKITSSASTLEQEVCGNSSSAAQNKATPFQLDGYTCK